MLTEEEARGKWCPFVRTGNGNNRVSAPPIKAGAPLADEAVGPCIASACMAWRWIERRNPQMHEVVLTSTHGYCGLASQPTKD